MKPKNIDFSELDAYILDCYHHLEFGTFERVDDGRSRLLENWWDQWREKFHELVVETMSDKPEPKEGGDDADKEDDEAKK